MQKKHKKGSALDWDGESTGTGWGSVRCWNGFFGCGTLLPVQGKDQDTGSYIVPGFNAKVGMCSNCCEVAAGKWGIPSSTLDFLMTARRNAAHKKGFDKPAKSEVMALYDRMVEMHRKEYKFKAPSMTEMRDMVKGPR